MLPSLKKLTLAVLVLSSPAAAQELQFVLPGDFSSDHFGYSVAGAGDVNADGYPDVVVGGYRGFNFMGRVKVFSGIDGTLLHHVIGNPGDYIGFQVDGAGDVNMDGFDDFIQGSLNGSVSVYSGVDASVLFSFPTGGGNAAGYGDVDSDGHADFLVGNMIHSGSDGSVLKTFVPGFRITLAGDVNGDGEIDYITFNTGHVSSPVEVRSAADNSLLYSIPAVVGYATGVGDVNADGRDDFVIADREPLTITVYSGLDGSVLHRIPAPWTSLQPGIPIVGGAGDSDGDGHDDFLIGGNSPRIVSGATGCTLAQLSHPYWAGSVASAGDIDGDGDPDVVIGYPGNSGPNSEGTAVLFSYDGVMGAPYCVSTVNSTGGASKISASGSTSVALDILLLTASNVPAGQFGLFYYGPAQTQVAFGNGFRCVGGGATGVVRLPVIASSTTRCLELELDIANQPPGSGSITAGSTWNFQAWFRDAAAGGAAFDLSDGLQVVFTP